MPFFKRTQKSVASRLKGNLDYYSRPSTMRSLRGWLFFFSIIFGLLFVFAYYWVKGPEKVEGIKVGRFVGKLHFLHSCGCGYNTADDTLIGKYVVHYDDKTTADIEIVYGKDVVDWWVGADRKDPTRSKVGWEGENAPAKAAGSKIKLSVSAWENPHPKKKVVSIDYVATEAATDVCPFCVAITAQDK